MAAGVLVAFALAVSGCTGRPEESPAPVPTPAPSPTYLCTPDPSAAPTPCSPEQFSEETRLTILYDEATRNYQRFFNEHVKLLRAGGADKATANLLAVAGGPYLDATVTNLRRLRELKVRAGTGEIRLVRLDRSPGAPNRGYEVALATCVDSTGVALLQDDTEVKLGSAYQETVFFKRDAGILKIWDAEGARVQAC